MTSNHLFQIKQRCEVAFQIILSLLFLTALPSCSINQNSETALIGYQYTFPQETSDGWETASLTSVGMIETPLIRLMDELEAMEAHHLHSLVIVKNGKLIFEEYFQGDKFNLAEFTGETGFDRNDAHNLCSVTKSITSAIIGIAIDQGEIDSVQQKVSDFFPEYSDLFANSVDKQNLTIEDMLTMRSGIEWDDESTSYFDARNDMHQMFISDDPIKYILSKEVISAPGSKFEYSNCNTNLLGEIVQRATGLRIDEYAEKYLFSKLGITNYEWQMISPEVVFTSGDLRLRPRDMAKIGYLFLSGGIWRGDKIISQDWIQQSTTKLVDLNSGPTQIDWADGYGYQWWNWDSINGQEFHAYFASGWGGQWIIISPEHDLVVVSTAENYYSEVRLSIQILLEKYILPSIEPSY